jgi:molecular chaperone GrpE
MTPKRKKKGNQQKSAAKSGVESETAREDDIPEVSGAVGPDNDSIGEAGRGEAANGADPTSNENDRSEGSGAQDLEEAQAQIEELNELHLRARAEADNIRKRAEAEISNVRKFALEGFARELLTVKDSLELARAVDLEADSSNDSIAAKVAEGLDLTIQQLESTFARFSIEEVSPEPGDKLDPEQHQAMTIEETTEIEPNRICRVIQKGYLLHNRLLRPAMVIVAKAPVDA